MEGWSWCLSSCWAIGEVMVVIEMVDEQDDIKVGEVVTKEKNKVENA